MAAQTGGAGTTGATGTQTQSSANDPMLRALSAEEKNDLRTAAVAYRQTLQEALSPNANAGDRVAISLLGLERVWAELGVRDSIVPVAQRVVALRPTDPVAHSIILRTLVALSRDDEARAAFLRWRRVAGNDGAPYREYARLLMSAGRARAADSVLGEAGKLLGPSGMLSGEVAQLNVALERWNGAAVAFREALAQQPYLESAALFALGRSPVPTRDSIRSVLAGPPVLLPVARLLSSLELAWGEPRRAWTALAALPASTNPDSLAATWSGFAERAEASGAWTVARDAWAAILERRPSLNAQTHAAAAALASGDPAGALALVKRDVTDARATAADRSRALVAIEIAALGELGRAPEAEARLQAVSASLDEDTRASLFRPLVAVWLRAGDLTRARAAIVSAQLDDDDETMGWLALYEGELATARKRLVRADTRRIELVDALGLLARVRAAKSVELGQAFLTLAKRDTVTAVNMLVRMADSSSTNGIGDAAPALLGFAARLVSATPQAMTLWDRITTRYPRSPEAPEAHLYAARALLAKGDKAAAAARLETLIVEYPESALLPQARRELDRLR